MSGAAFTVCVSGAVPTLDEQARFRWGEADVRLLVKRLARAVYARGWRLVHGCHPTFTPILEHEARRVDWRGRTELFVARCFFEEERDFEAFRDRHADYARVVVIGDAATPVDEALTELRTRMVAACSALVAVGGRLHLDGARRPGVAEEIELARAAAKPVLPLAGFGGYVHELVASGAEDTDRLVWELAGEWLATDVVASLVGSVDPWELVDVVTRALDTLAERA